MGAYVGCFFVVATSAAQPTLRVAYVGTPTGSQFAQGWGIFSSKLSSSGSVSVAGAEDWGIETIEHFVDDSNSNANRSLEVRAAIGRAAAQGAVAIVAGTSRINRDIMAEAEIHGIPNIHCSGGDPTIWLSSQPHSYGMHVQFTSYSRGPIRVGYLRGMRRLTIWRDADWRFVKVSGMAALEWAREAGYSLVGPTLSWCQKWAHLTNTCRIVQKVTGRRCICGEQSEADALQYKSLNVEEVNGIYEMANTKVLEPNLIGSGPAPVISQNTTRFLEGVIDDMRAQGADPDVVVSWLAMHRSAIYAATRKRLVPKMWVGLPNKGGTGWAGVELETGQELTATHAMYSVVGVQWTPELELSDPLFGTSGEYVRLHETAHGGKPGYDSAACAGAGSTLFTALSKYAPPLGSLDLAARREALRRAVGNLNDETVFGQTRFNSGGQNNGRGAVTVQFHSDGVQHVVLPEDLAQRELTLPFPSWEARFGCPSGTYNTRTSCLPCQSGRFSSSSSPGLTKTECQACPASTGTMSEEVGATQCRDCPAGYMQDGLHHQGVCRACSPGNYRNSSMPGDACAPCAPGTISGSEAAISCTICPEGTFQSKIQERECICDVGWFRGGNATGSPCQPCGEVLPGSTTRFSGSSSSKECTCGQGRLFVDGACKDCEEIFPPGSVYCAGFGQLPVLQAGWMTPPTSRDVYLCPGDGSACPGGVEVGVERCSPGGSDIACAWCSSGYRYNVRLGRCLECSGSWPVLLFLLLPAAAMVAFSLRPPTLEYGERTLLRYLRTTLMLLTVSQVVDLFQTFTIWSSSSIKWSQLDEGIFSGIGGIFNFDSLGLTCGIRNDRKSHALFLVTLMNLIPLFYITWLFICVLPAILYPKLAETYRIPSPISASNQALGTLVSFFTTVVNWAISLVFSRYKHPMINDHSLHAFPYVLISSSEISGLTAVACISLALWCVGSIVLITTLLVLLRRPHAGLLLRRCTVALVVRHKDGKSWWLIVEMVKKLLITLSVAAVSRPDWQLQWMGTVELLYSQLLVYVRPYRFQRHNFSDFVFTLGKLIIILQTVTSIYQRDAAHTGVTVVLGALAVFSVTFIAWNAFTLGHGGAQCSQKKRSTRVATRMVDQDLITKFTARMRASDDPVRLSAVVGRGRATEQEFPVSEEEEESPALPEESPRQPEESPRQESPRSVQEAPAASIPKQCGAEAGPARRKLRTPSPGLPSAPREPAPASPEEEEVEEQARKRARDGSYKGGMTAV